MPDAEQGPNPTPDADGDLDDGSPDVAEEPEVGPGHPLRAADVQALIQKEIG